MSKYKEVHTEIKIRPRGWYKNTSNDKYYSTGYLEIWYYEDECSFSYFNNKGKIESTNRLTRKEAKYEIRKRSTKLGSLL